MEIVFQRLDDFIETGDAAICLAVLFRYLKMDLFQIGKPRHFVDRRFSSSDSKRMWRRRLRDSLLARTSQR